MIARQLKVEDYLEKGKILVIYGARQVGKTTLVRSFLTVTDLPYQAFTADAIEFADNFARCDLRWMKGHAR